MAQLVLGHERVVVQPITTSMSVTPLTFALAPIVDGMIKMKTSRILGKRYYFFNN
ncbi:MAG: hypothetical protein JRJ45_01025 [Deltaproteobacteria bacterium]|nr:hypothetical protein [Deltaproteobacteria bacterium]